MNPGILISLLLAHFAADFPLQNKKIIELRNSSDMTESLFGNGIHTGIHFIVMFILVLPYWSIRAFLMVIAISIYHFSIDYLKTKGINQLFADKHSISVFLLDQIIHIICIMLTVFLLSTPSPVKYLRNNSGDELVEAFVNSMKTVNCGQKLLLVLTLLIVGLWGVGIFIRIVMEKLNSISDRNEIQTEKEAGQVSNTLGPEYGGFIIGILERLFTIIAMTLNMPTMIGFILAVKSVARLKKFEDERFVEVFIIGSFISFISAISVGCLIALLIK